MTDSEAERVRGIVLAGGRSTRFGAENKALATFDGRPLVDRAVGAVAEATDGTPILSVSTDTQADRLAIALQNREVETVYDSETRAGPLAGLSAAVEAADAPWLFVCACDMPLVTPDSISALTARVGAGGVGSAGEPDAVVPIVDGHDQPLHALYRRPAVAATVEKLTESDAMMALLGRLTVERVEAGDANAALAAATTNVNTRADLESVRDRQDRA
jgi:molybdopterin-guanine dinucleotide biosynthesis protein A